MNDLEAIRFIRMLTDDSRDWYPTVSLINYTINTAIRRKIEESYANQDERALRPLYTSTAWMPNNTLIPDILYPRACKLKYAAADSDNLSHGLTYLDPDIFFNFNQPGDIATLTYPRSSNYTIYWDTINNVSGKYFTATNNTQNERFKLWYIKEPNVFEFVPLQTAVYGTNIQLPAEYHVEILTLAAEMLNDIDVGEYERGQVAFQNQRLDMQSVGGG